MFNLSNLFIILGAVLFTVFGILVIIKLGEKIGYIDCPNERSSHSKSIPKGGGIGILAGYILVSIFKGVSVFFWLPTVTLSLYSFWGDKTDLPVKNRLLVQFATAAVVLAYFSLKTTPLWMFSRTSSNLLIYGFVFIFCLVFIVGTANFFNFMDGINGIAALTGAIAFISLGYVAADKDLTGYGILAFGIAISCVCFLPWNIGDAKIFLGDVGSIFLGFVFSILVIRLSETFFDFLCYTLFIFPFYGDEVLTMIMRISKKEPILKAHRRHLYQVLANEGNIAHWKISSSYAAFQAIVCVVVIGFKNLGLLVILFLIATLILGFSLLYYSLIKKYA